MRIKGLMLGVLAAAAACGTEPGIFRVGCSRVEAVQVGQGLAPSIDWDPGCPVAEIAVFEAIPRTPPEDPVPPLPTEHPDYAAGQLQWAIATPDSLGNRLEASIRYGDVPAHTLEQQPAQPLQVGQRYLVRLTVRGIDGFSQVGAWGVFIP